MDNIIDGVGGTRNTNGNWWDYGTGYPYFPWNPSGISGGGGPYEPDWSWWWTGGGGMGYYYQGVYVSPISYPGMEFGYPFEWWNDDIWIENNFSMNIDGDNYDDYKKLTYQERQWVKSHPFQAIEFKKNMQKAFIETNARFTDPATIQNPNPKLNTKADAFRHAYWCALNTLSCGSTFAQEYGNAHESEVPSLLYQEKDMDVFNNSVGINIAISYWDPNTIADVIYSKLLNGELKYLKPLDYTQSPAYDSNRDGIPDCPTCRNGFMPGSTQLTPTNQ